MKNAQHDIIHGEAIIDGDASTGVEFAIFRNGVEITSDIVNGTYGIAITDIDCTLEAGGDLMVLSSDTESAGGRVIKMNVAANGGVSRSFKVEHYLPKGSVPYFFGAATGLNSCIIHGYLHRG